MNRIKIAIAVFVAILIIVISFDISFHSTFGEFYERTKEIEKLADDEKWDEAIIEVMDMITKFDELKDFYSMTLDHKYLEEIEVTLNKVLIYAKANKKIGFDIENKILSDKIKHLMDEEFLSMKNVF